MKIPLLVDEHFPAPSITTLRSAGFDLFSIAESCPGIDDGDVLLRAVKDQRWLITFDRDYGELIFARGHPSPPAVFLFRVQSYRPDTPAQWVMQLTQDAKILLGKFTVFDGATLRSRPFLKQASHGNS